MIGFFDDINGSVPFSDFDFVDTDPAFLKAREQIDFLIPEFIKYISGDRTRSKVYGNIKKYYPEELIFMNNNILDNNANSLNNIDTIVEDSCALYSNLRIVILKGPISLPNITGFDILSFTKGDIFINTIFIQDIKVNTMLAFNICIKLFDRIILNNLYNHNIPVHCSKYVPILYDGTNGFQVSKFIIDYFYELLFPFVNKISVTDEELREIAHYLSKSNFEIIHEDYLIDQIFKFIKNKQKGIEDDFDYLELIMNYQNILEDNNLIPMVDDMDMND